MTRRQRRRFRRALLAFVLLIFAAIVLACTAHAQPLPWAYVVWESPTPLTGPRSITTWGQGVAIFGDYIAAEGDHGTINFTYRARCWRIELRSGSFYREWWERSACYNYQLPFVGISPHEGAATSPAPTAAEWWPARE